MSDEQKKAHLAQLKNKLPELVDTSAKLRELEHLMVDFFSPKSFDEKRILKEQHDKNYHNSIEQYTNVINRLEKDAKKN
jgi:hypothetical protein